MSKPVTILDVIEHPSTSGALPSKYVLILSDGTKTDVLTSFNATHGQVGMAIANRLLELNQVAYWHPITNGHVQALIKFKHAVIRKGVNSVHTSDDMNGTENELSKFEYGNWSTLRFHGLVAKDDAAGAGYWLLTRRGNEFIMGQLAIPKRVKTLNNKVEDHDELLVTITDVYGSQPFFPRKHEIGMETPERRELVQGALL